jgi:hypothetical protein
MEPTATAHTKKGVCVNIHGILSTRTGCEDNNGFSRMFKQLRLFLKSKAATIITQSSAATTPHPQIQLK